jgi:hypothetical protein
MAPFFLAYGLVKGAYIGTEALSTVVMHITKLVPYRQAAVLPMHAVITGLILGPVMILGSLTENVLWIGCPTRKTLYKISSIHPTNPLFLSPLQSATTCSG